MDTEAHARIAELERQVKGLQEQLDIEQRFRTDRLERDFKIWLQRHRQPQGTAFAKKFLDDRAMLAKASRAKYEFLLNLHKYSEADIFLFQDAWKTMLLLQS